MGDPSRQRHDWEPGIRRSGLFWTIPVASSAISFDTRTGQARFRASEVRVKDFHDILNAVLGGGPRPIPSHVSFDVRWHGHGRRMQLKDRKFGFAGVFVTGKATISFSARDDRGGVVYKSDPGGQFNPTVRQGGAGPPAVGHERNGVFFR